MEDVVDVLSKVRGQARQDNLGFWVAKTGVELDDLGTLVGQNQASIEHAQIRPAVRNHALKNRLDNGVNRCVHHALRQVGNRSVSPHTTCVGTLVAVKGTLVVLGCRQNVKLVAIDQSKEGKLLTRQELLDDHAGTRVAELVVQEHLPCRFDRLLDGFRHDHALAQCQAVRLDHDWCTLLFDVGFGFFEVGKCAKGCCWNAVFDHDLFGKVF